MKPPALPQEPGLHGLEDADLLEHVQRLREERLAEVKAREPVLFEQEDTTPELRETSRTDGTARTSAHDDDIEALAHLELPPRETQSAALGGGPSWIRSPMYAPMSVNMMPIALMTT